MHATHADTSRRSGQEPADHDDRFDGETARRILERAAAEQQRLSNRLTDTWSTGELEEIAAEAGISPEALHSAVAAQARDAGRSAKHGRFRRFDPRHWPGTLKGIVLTGGSAAFIGALLLFPAFAQTVLWMLLLTVIALSVLILLGASPF